MSTFFKDRSVKATRKPHRCSWCGELIAQGGRAKYSSGIFDGDFYSQYMHPECHAAAQSIAGDLEDGWDIRQFTRGRTDDDKLPPEFTPDGEPVKEAA